MRHREAFHAELSPRAADAVAAARHHLGRVSERQLEAILGAIQSRMAAAAPISRKAHVFRAAFATALAGAAATSVFFVRSQRHPEPISFRVEGADLLPGGYVEADAGQRPVVRFSDGSEVALSGGARAHVRTVDERGARVTLDEGKAHVYVVHSNATRWSFDAGPFVVAVTGTAFGLSWVEAEHRLDVRLENGAVTVSGPVFETQLALRAGQWLTVRSHDVLIRDLSSVEPAGSDAAIELSADPAPLLGGAGEPPAKGGAAPERAARVVHARAAPAQGPRWATALANGKFAAIVEDAQRIGLDVVYATSSGEELAALADAARYTRQYPIARDAFLAQRRRFSSSERAEVAAFFLGRLAETDQDVRGALSWFDRYLGEAPEGTYAAEAMGRKMVLAQQRDGKGAARPMAEDYLRRFPTGTYAQTARALTLGP